MTVGRVLRLPVFSQTHTMAVAGFENMKFLDLFAGIGGFRLGMEAAGNSVTVNVIAAIAERLI